jgi:3-hydroxyacyl-CoA dehydrogenase/enoyl-CoA hydratase/3-hydroxybutyryl-CoA epimerase
MNTTLRHWQPTIDGDNIAWLKLKYADGSTNILSHEVVQELETLITGFQQKLPRGIVILSANSNGFIAGANINEFTSLEKPEAAYERLRYGQKVFAALEKLDCPTVALINGFCLGGGLELVLSCRYRIVLDSEKTRLGFPEILLGIHPGWGGCERAPKLIGAPAALDLILTGRTVNAKAAKAMGLVDAVVPLREFERAASYYINKQPKKHQLAGWKKLTNAAGVRVLLGWYMRRQLHAKVIEAHYPAPFSALNLWEKVGPNAPNAYEKEAESVSKLVGNSTTKNLLRVYFLREQLKKVGESSTARLKRVHVIGAGTMGGDIAAWCALQGYDVSVQDQQLKMLASTEKRATKLINKKLNKKYDRQAILDHLILDTTGEGIKHADIIIEAIPEVLDLKQKVWESVEKQAKPDAILATNTSSIPLTEITANFKDPHRLIGLHFFNPVSFMQLIEVVNAPGTDVNILNTAYQFVKKINKLVLPTHSSPGFLVNRVLTPYLLEASALVVEGVPIKQIDHALEQFGMPMGPIAVADTVGLDVCLAVAEHLAGHYGWTVPEIIRDKVKNGQLGKKSGSGFYKYTKSGKPYLTDKSAGTSTLTDKEITQRLILRLLNEAVACLREKIVADADKVDAGLIFGAGFAPFLGGPLCYAQSVGIANIVQQLNELQKKYGDRFAPDKGWELF